MALLSVADNEKANVNLTNELTNEVKTLKMQFEQQDRIKLDSEQNTFYSITNRNDSSAANVRKAERPQQNQRPSRRQHRKYITSVSEPIVCYVSISYGSSVPNNEAAVYRMLSQRAPHYRLSTSLLPELWFIDSSQTTDHDAVDNLCAYCALPDNFPMFCLKKRYDEQGYWFWQ